MTEPVARDRPRLTSQVVFGLFIIAIGVLFTLDNLGLLDAADYVQYWPSLLVAIGMLKVWQARRSGQGVIPGLMFLGVGSYMLIEHLTYIRIDARMFWPLVLLAVGGSLVWRGIGHRRLQGVAADGHSRFSALAIMGGAFRRSSAQTFAGADLTAVMGGCEIDLRQASMAPGSDAVIDVFAFWGGIELKVPEDWTVVSNVIPLMGGVEDRTHPPQAGAPQKRLVIRGVVIMGGVSVKN